jgi:hypothetical protein
VRRHRVQIFSSFERALDGWTATTRVSPILPLNSGTPPSLENEDDQYLFFVGPIDPATVDLRGLTCFLSYGTYNLLIFASSEEKQLIVALLSTVADKPWEAWHIRSGEIVDVAFSPVLQNEKPVGSVRLSRGDLPGDLKGAVDEYRTMLAVVRAKAARYIPKLAQEFDAFNSSFETALFSDRAHAIVKLSWLVNINAALSRFLSQTFAGTSPILETECHYWTHSLLGTGLASQALLQIRRHFDEALASSRITTKLRALGDRNSTKKRLIQCPSTDPDWHKHYLQNSPVLSSAPDSTTYLRLIVYFSGRDGFRSTNLTLSAPLQVITACNTYSWTLLTLTHELSHVVANNLVSVLLGDLNNGETTARLAQLAELDQPISDMEQAQQVLMTALAFIDREKQQLPSTAQTRICANDVLPIFQAHRGELFELITHVLDFQYFYQRNVRLYMTSIWASWDVIPNIISRIDDYLVRSLAAIFTNNWLLHNAIETTMAMVKAELEHISAEFPTSQYIHIALGRLNERRAEFKAKLETRSHLAKLVMAFFYDPAAAAAISREQPVSGGRYSNLRVNEFSEDAIDNPLSFLVAYATDKRPDSKKSIWMLHKLAFRKET